MVSTCPTCATPLDEAGGCITCAAKGEGLVLLARNGYAQIREVMTLLEGQGLSAEMEKVPPATKEEAHHPKWNLYVPEAEVAVAGAFGLQPGRTTPDGRFTLVEVECLGACDKGPCLLAGDTLHENLTPAALDAILRELE